MAQTDIDEDGAARWALRLDAGDLDAVEQAKLNNWLAVGERRQSGLLRAWATLSYLDRGRALGSLAADEDEDGPEATPWRVGRRGVCMAMLASGVAAACVGLMLRPREQILDTGVGEIRRVPLEDGSLATLNTSSRMMVSMAARRRTISVHQGEAWFRVAPDKARPFVVEVGEIRVQAVGTAFSVRRRTSGADVLVTEGTVETWVVGREDERRLVTAGSRGFVVPAQPTIEVAAAPQEVERALAWRSGELALDGETLDYAVQEINRYNVRQIVIADPALGQEKLVGYFSTTQPESFGVVVAGMIGAKVVNEGDVIRLVKEA